MSQLFSVGEILEATGGRGEGLAPDGVRSISIDSREIGPDALFVAIKGDVHDGHAFVQAAKANGAVMAMVSQDKAAGLGDRLVVVPDALEGLIALARASRARSSARIVAVTGSVGKTTTKEAIRQVFEAAGRTHASIKSFNNHWGVPLMLARMPRDTEFAVFEVGMNHAGEITPLTRLVRPNIAVITTVAAAHLEAFDSIEGIADAKAEIFAGLEPGGTAVLNSDHPLIGRLTASAKAQGVRNIVTYGFAPDADWRIEDVRVEGEGARATVYHDGTVSELSIAAHGAHMVANAVAALIVARLSGVAEAVALTALRQFGAQAGRGQVQRLGPEASPLVLIDESYNANVASMTAAMAVFSERQVSGKKVLVLGDMLELGPQGPALHAGLAEAALATGADEIYLVGPGMQALADVLGDRATRHAANTADIAETVLNRLAYGDAIMIKGSNGMKLGALVRLIADRFA